MKSKVATASRKYAADLVARREFAWYMAMGNLRSRNASTSLGLLWWIINPLLQAIVYYVVFGLLLDISRDLSFLVSGIFVFYYTSTSITSGSNSVIQNRALLINLQFPKLIMPATALIEAGAGFLASVPAMYLILGPTDGLWPSLSLLMLPLTFGIHTLFNFGLAALAARITVPFRDMTNILPHALRIWFYLSPILYMTSQIEDMPDWALRLFHLNPMVPILDISRSALLGLPLDGNALLSASLWAVGLATVSIVAFVRYEGKMARYL